MDVGALLKMREVEVGRLLRILLAKGGMCQGGPPVEDMIAHRLGRVLHRRPTSHNPALSLQPTLQASAARRQAMLSRMVAKRSGAARPDHNKKGRRADIKQQAVLALRRKRRVGLKRRFQSPCVRRRRIGRAIALRQGRSKGTVSWLPSHNYTARRFHMRVLSLPSTSTTVTQRVSVPSHCVMRQASRVIRTFRNGGCLVSDCSAMGMLAAVPNTNNTGGYPQLLQSLEQHHAAKAVTGSSLLRVVDGWCVRITQVHIGTSGPVTIVGLSQSHVKVEGVAKGDEKGMSTWGVLLIAGPAGVLHQLAQRGCEGFGLHSAALWDQPDTATIRRQCAMSTTPSVLCTSVGWVEELHSHEDDGHVDTVVLHTLESGVAGVQVGVLDVEIDGVPCWPGDGAAPAVFRWRVSLGVLSPGGGLFISPTTHSEELICEDAGSLGHDALHTSLEVSRRAVFQRSRRAYGKAVGSGRAVGLSERGMVLGCLGRPIEGDFAAIRWPGSVSEGVRSQDLISTNPTLPVRKGKQSMKKVLRRQVPTTRPNPTGQLLQRLLLSDNAAFVMLSLNSTPIPAVEGQVARRVLSGASVGAPVHRVVSVTLGEKREREDEDVPPPPAVVGIITSIVYNRLQGCYTAMALMPTPVVLDMPVTVGTSPSLVRGCVKAITLIQ